jgi:hypothetical protein
MSEKKIETVVEELEEAHKKATQGEWHIRKDGDEGSNGYAVRGEKGAITGWGCVTQKKANAEFIVLSHNLLPALISDWKRQQQQWQPIESAPKDGTRILIYVPNHGCAYACGFENGLWQTGITELGFRNRSLPSHWMTIPEPPKEPNL